MSSGKLFLFVDISPKPRMHVYAPGREGYIGVGLTLDANPAFTSATPQFPRAEKMFFAPLNEMQLVYTKPFRIVQPITVTPDLRKPLRVTGSLRYQACDDKVCFVPQTVGIEWTTASKPEIRPR
jgi:thiol:disulfide interchange protein DsbD